MLRAKVSGHLPTQRSAARRGDEVMLAWDAARQACPHLQPVDHGIGGADVQRTEQQ